LRFKANPYSAPARFATAAVFAAYLVLMAGTLGFRKEKDRINVLANRLSMERNISLELELRMTEEKIAADQVVASLSVLKNSDNIILGRIVDNYMFNISKNNDILVELFPENEKDQDAIAYFTQMVSLGTPIADGSRFRFRKDAGGRNYYTGSFAYYYPGNGVTMMLLTISPKSNREDRGYASILGYSAPGDVLMPANYSFAKYSSSNLVSYTGNYAYPTVLDVNQEFELLNSPTGVVRINGYTHFINSVSDEDLILISRQKTEDFLYVVAFLFLTLIFYFCLSLISLTRPKPESKEKNYYKSRINAAMMLALVMTLITLTTVSVLFVYRRNNANLRSSMADKINSLQTLLEARCRYAQDYTAFNTQEASNVLEDISNTMKSDITLYTTDGKEFRSTTPEVFERMLLGSRINQEAFENLIYKNRRYYIGQEDVGPKRTWLLYAPVFNGQGKMIAIMGSPFTDGSFDFKSKAVIHSVTLITVFIFLLLLARFLMGRAVDKMFKPISEIGRKMNEVDINNLEYIVYDRDDEVSTLVRAYNLMVHDLYNSTKQLTQAERDKAWATMARQVAHEIKNPLTPIKLQIQRLIRMKANGNPAWSDRFDEISQEVLGQIDLLADTANEFSTFAKLYTEEPVEIDLDKLLKEQVDLFDSREDITFSYMGLSGAKVTGPKPQLTRVFVNLLGNSVQAIENSQNENKGRINVSLRLSSKEGFYDIVFEDNGPGVSDENRSKLFTPNFTTKSNGTGLGLAICRNIIEKCNGEILYSKSFSLKGACFTVRYPRKK
ncbi:MAG: HAMP domain-containing histidine kinase, partial [Bacteroidales bacterium]|nr:HAMP domain-containing histidine kinase [Bacteroidales bacterium]